ncbi:hypothetical protein AQJ30_15710 [Streptomyces longwoodensis]|uniref:Uncharacterized protein n=1 Tax=Streptomyces longwoodensis TaxID=68231 RepID=A0A101QX23_9ACTN|nr:hypothetical protein [Streptomyces longwoodensis]KUN37729.1 hypothetical protein AQJ30_15710 [Streptomyces longwoodensis]
MIDQPDLDKGETAVRAALRRLGARPAGHAAEDEPQRAPAPVPAVAIPPRPAHPPTIPAPAPGPHPGDRLPEWWRQDKPPLGEPPAAPAAPAAPQPAPGDAPADQPAAPRLNLVEKTDDEPDADEADTDDETVGERPHRKWATRLRRPDREPTRPRFATATPFVRPEKRSLAELVGAIPPHKKWALYAGSGLAAGWFFGIPQFFTDVTASVAQHEGTWRNSPDVYFWAVAAAVAVGLDRATRRSWFLIAWATRGLTVCIAIGALLYGNPIQT